MMIKLLSTGGTIACKPSERGLAPALTAEDMLKVIGVDSHDISCKDLFSMDSSNVQPEEWLMIADEIRSVCADVSVSGIVLTHGTDTMAYTASMLSFLLRGINLPVVITGAQQPIVFEGSDGRENLSDALLAVRNLPAGVYICFGGVCILGCRAVKTHTMAKRAFESINYPIIAGIKNGIFTFEAPCTDKRACGVDFSQRIDGRVALMKLIPGTSPQLIDCVKSCDISGLVVESFGLGGVHSFRRDHNESLINLMKSGIAVVLTSQCLYEPSALDVYEVSRTLNDAGAISAYDMTTESCVTKLMWALGQTKDISLVGKLMRMNLCGEISPT